MVRAHSRATRKINIEFSVRLLEQTDAAAAAQGSTRSTFIRSAVERYIENANQEELERALAEGYQANARRDREIAAEFAHLDGENL